MSQPPTVNTTRPDIFDLPVPPRRLPFTPSGEDPPLGCWKTEDDSLTPPPSPPVHLHYSWVLHEATLQPVLNLAQLTFCEKQKKVETEESIPPSSQGQRTNSVSIPKTWAKTQTDPRFTYFNHYWYFSKVPTREYQSNASFNWCCRLNYGG